MCFAGIGLSVTSEQAELLARCSLPHCGGGESVRSFNGLRRRVRVRVSVTQLVPVPAVCKGGDVEAEGAVAHFLVRPRRDVETVPLGGCWLRFAPDQPITAEDAC